MQLNRSSAVVSVIFILAMFGCSSQQELPATAAKPKGVEPLSATTVLASIPKSEKPEAISQVMFSDSGNGVTYLVRKKNGSISVVHNGKPGKEYPVTISKVIMSADGQHVAYGALVGDKWSMVVDGKEGQKFDSLISPLFSPDGRHIAYFALENEKWYPIVDGRLHPGAKTGYAQPIFNANSTLIAYVENQDKAARLIVSDLRSGKQYFKKATGKLLVSNKDRTRLAATQAIDNKVRVVDFSFERPDDINEGRSYHTISDLTFGDDGVSLSYVAVKDSTRLLVLNDREEPLPDGELLELPVIRPDKKGVVVLLASKNGPFLHHAFFDSADKGKKYDETANLVYSGDSRFYAYAARKGQKWFVVVNDKEGPLFDRVVTPVFSPDGSRLVYRARKNGKRFVVVADTDGKTIKQHRAYEQVFQPVFTVDGKSIAYGVKDGNKLICQVDGI